MIFDLGTITRETELRHVEFHETLDSTSKLAGELLGDLLPLSPSLVLTETQTSGRGRGANQWWAGSGALTFTLVHDVAQIDLSPAARPLVALAVGAAVRRSLAEYMPSNVVTLKWPNDVHVGEQKICGILTEQRVVDDKAALLIGVGVNANNSLQFAPPEIRNRATSIYDVTNEHTDLCQLLIQLVNEVRRSIDILVSNSDALLAEINQHCFLRGRDVEIETPNGIQRGTCLTIDNDGSLILQTQTGLQGFIAGTIIGWSQRRA